MVVPFAFGLPLLLLVASAAGQLVLAMAVFVVQALLTLGSIRYAKVPAATSAAVISLTAGVVATVVVFTVLDHDTASSLSGVLGLVLLAMIVVQLRRRDRSDLFASLTWTLSLSVLSVLLVSWVTLRGANHGAVSTSLALVGVAVHSLAEAVLGREPWVRTAAVIVAGSLAALISLVPAIGEAAPPLTAVSISAFGALLASAGSAIIDRIEQEVPSASGGRRRSQGRRRRRKRGGSGQFVTLQLTLPLVMAAPVSYVLGRMLVG